jgi:hypothetical protein
MIEKIISGGQTGVDRAALDVALEENFPCGGWCPKGRLAEDGILSECYPLEETDSPDYEVRTKQNILDSDATLIIAFGCPTGGTALTIKQAVYHNKPYLVIDLEANKRNIIGEIVDWIDQSQIRILNVAGPRATKAPYIYKQAKKIIQKVLAKKGNF